MFNDFPREVANPFRQLVFSSKDFLKFVNKNNGKKDVYTSIYIFENIKDNKPVYDSAKVDLIFFDFDGKEAHSNMIKLHKLLLNSNIKHQINFSGNKGFHVYAFTSNVNGNKKGILKNAHLYFKSLGIDFDSHVAGDIARVSRVPNTLNIKSQKFCIPLREDMLNDEAEIRKAADEQYFNNHTTIGKNLLVLESLPLVKEVFNLEEAKEARLNVRSIFLMAKELGNLWLNDPLLKYVQQTPLSGKDMDKNNILFKNLAIMLVNYGASDVEIEQIARSVVKNCPGHTVNEFLGWVRKAKEGELCNFNKIELNRWIERHNIPVEKYKVGVQA